MSVQVSLHSYSMAVQLTLSAALLRLNNRKPTALLTKVTTRVSSMFQLLSYPCTVSFCVGPKYLTVSTHKNMILNLTKLKLQTEPALDYLQTPQSGDTEVKGPHMVMKGRIYRYKRVTYTNGP